jgi:hypothetical protein
LPACNFTGNLELTLGGAKTHDDTGTYTSDFILQGKTVVRPLETDGWGLAVSVGMDRHLHTDTSGQDWYANALSSFSLRDDRLILHANLGWLREQQSSDDHLTWGLGSETQLAEKTWLIAEMFGQSSNATSYQIGLRHWLWVDRIQFDATYGNRMGSPSGGQWFSLGLRLLAEPFLP